MIEIIIFGFIAGISAISVINYTYRPLTEEEKKKKNDDYFVSSTDLNKKRE